MGPVLGQSRTAVEQVSESCTAMTWMVWSEPAAAAGARRRSPPWSSVVGLAVLVPVPELVVVAPELVVLVPGLVVLVPGLVVLVPELVVEVPLLVPELVVLVLVPGLAVLVPELVV